MEDLSMFQRPRTIALEYQKPGTYGTVLIYPLDRLVECGFVGNMATPGFRQRERVLNEVNMEDLSMFQRPRTVALEYEKPGTYGTVLIYPLDRLVECGFTDYMPTSILGISGIHGDTRDTLIHGQAPLLSISLNSLFCSLYSHSQLQPPFFSQPKSSLALTRWENDPSLILVFLNWLQASCDNSFV
ncbi:hypothetical protein PIB30_027389 [Stylosanthes scabra]|uniref:Uncharacterized protein n=1 Tax=Stylosanthes scabra TaxID=79078 RepID=A0ABU6U9J6_9FABA|nr:hypothetical protein [Stylosanthes scabra]